MKRLDRDTTIAKLVVLARFSRMARRFLVDLVKTVACVAALAGGGAITIEVINSEDKSWTKPINKYYNQVVKTEISIENSTLTKFATKIDSLYRTKEYTALFDSVESLVKAVNSLERHRD